MFKKYYQYILLFLTSLFIVSAQAANYLEDEGKNDEQETHSTPKGYYNYTLQHSKRKIDNSIHPEELEDEKGYLRDHHITEKLKSKKDTIFFMVITSNNKPEALNKFFFFNRDPIIEQDALKRVQRDCGCHIITHTKPKLNPHILFQLLGWLEQSQRRYLPIFIYANAAVCVTCDGIISNLFNLKILSNAKGCNGLNSINLEDKCPLAQQYIKRALTFPLAKKLLLPTLRLEHEHKLKLLENSNETLQKKCNNLEQKIALHIGKYNKLSKKKRTMQIEFKEKEEQAQNNYKEIQEQKNKLENKLNLLKSKNNKLTKDLSLSKSLAKKSKEHLSEANEEATKLLLRSEELQRECDNLEKELKRKTQSNSTLTHQNNQLEEKQNALRKDYNNLKEDNTQIQKKFEEQIAANIALQEKNTQLANKNKNELNLLKNKNNQLEKKQNALRKDYNNLKADNTQIHKKFEEQTEANISLQKKIKLYNTNIMHLIISIIA